jgi:hypothetical protein
LKRQTIIPVPAGIQLSARNCADQLPFWGNGTAKLSEAKRRARFFWNYFGCVQRRRQLMRIAEEIVWAKSRPDCKAQPHPPPDNRA